MTLNLCIRQIRKQRGLTIAELAEVVGVSTAHMSEVERGVKNLNNHLLERISDALKVEPSDLISPRDRSDVARLMRAIGKLDEKDRERVELFVNALLASTQEPQRTE